MKKPEKIHFALNFKEFESSAACESIISAYKAEEIDAYHTELLAEVKQSWEEYGWSEELLMAIETLAKAEGWK